MHGFGKGAHQRFYSELESFGNRHERPYAILNVLEKETTQPIGLGAGQLVFANLALENTRQFCDAPGGGIQAVGSEREIANRFGIGFIEIAFGNVCRVEICVQDRSSSRIRPLSPTRGILEIIASRLGSLRRVDACSRGRISATGTPDFSTMNVSPSATARTIALVCKCSSRTVVRFMLVHGGGGWCGHRWRCCGRRSKPGPFAQPFENRVVPQQRILRLQNPMAFVGEKQEL